MESKYQIPEQALADFSRGTGCESYKFLGAHLITMSGQVGIRFAVWAPSVKSVQVISEVDGWQKGEHWLDCLGSSGVWAGFFPELGVGTLYKYLIETADGKLLYKADPYAFSAEVRPGTASRVADIENYPWKDGAWMRRRAGTDHFKRPLNIYEVHLGSWKQHDVPGTTRRTCLWPPSITTGNRRASWCPSQGDG